MIALRYQSRRWRDGVRASLKILPLRGNLGLDQGARANGSNCSFHAGESGDKETVGSYRLEYYTPQEARKKGVKMCLVTLAAAIVSVVLPGVHFVSVPLGILASPLVGVYVYKNPQGAAKSMATDFDCPACLAKNHVASPNITAYYVSQCAACGCELRLEPS